MRIGIDLDGVCYPFVDVFRLYMETTMGRTYPPVERWDFYKDWGMDGLAFSGHMEHGCKEGVVFHFGTPPPDCLNAISELYDNGHEIVLITHRGDYARIATKDWVNRWDIPYDTLIVTDKPKTEFCLDVLLDDAPHIVEGFREAGGRGIVFRQPWNQHIGGERIYRWSEFLEMI